MIPTIPNSKQMKETRDVGTEGKGQDSEYIHALG